MFDGPPTFYAINVVKGRQVLLTGHYTQNPSIIAHGNFQQLPLAAELFTNPQPTASRSRRSRPTGVELEFYTVHLLACLDPGNQDVD
jgi:hypothetical protein